MRLMFVARAVNDTAGGVERMLVALMNAMVERGHHVDLFTWDLSEATSFYPIAREITWHRLDMGDPRFPAARRLLLLRARAIRSLVSQLKPHVIICFQDGPYLAIRAYTLGLQIPIIAAERNAPTRFDYIKAGRRRGLIYQGLRFASRVAIQCESYRALYPKFLQERIVCIPNPVLASSARAQPDTPAPDGRYRLLSVGRLGYQKNYAALIEAFAQLASNFPDWDLVIVGDGEERSPLERLIKARHLEDRVLLPGTCQLISDWYASSHLFCLPSRWEGFPNALAEALAHGLPAVGFADCAGIRELILDGESGLLAEGNGVASSLAFALAKLMDNCSLRRAMAKKAIASIEPFEPSTIFSQWERLLSEVVRL